MLDRDSEGGGAAWPTCKLRPTSHQWRHNNDLGVMLAHALEAGSTRVVTVNFSRLAEGLVSLCWAQWPCDSVACGVLLEETVLVWWTWECKPRIIKTFEKCLKIVHIPWNNKKQQHFWTLSCVKKKKRPHTFPSVGKSQIFWLLYKLCRFVQEYFATYRH
jgi:hypothetical protein